MALTIPRAGREYVTWTITGAPEGTTLELSVDHGKTWHALEREGDSHRALLAGPDAEGNPEGTVVLGARRSLTPLVRLKDTTEVVIREAGHIEVPAG